MRKIDLTGQRFGRLVVLEEVGRDKFGRVTWRCKCDCGNTCVVSSDHLRSGNTTSCGCFKHERDVECSTKHGLRNHPLYSVWQAMLKRTGVYKCSNDNDRRNYIARGISICDEWQNFQNFYDWCISHGYSKGLQIDRIDNDLGYSPDNCRWVTPKQNTNNRRNTHRLSDGTPLADLANSFGIKTKHRGLSGGTPAYQRIRHAFRKHGEQAAVQKVFDLALEQFADRHGFAYIENALAFI